MAEQAGSNWWKRGRWCVCIVSALMASLLLGGCASQPTAAPQPERQAVPIESQASADRLHEIAGCLLLYHIKHEKLPPRLAALAAEPGIDCPPLVSPDSGKPYVYHFPPQPLPGRPGRLLVHDPAVYAQGSQAFGEPVHWALLVDEKSTPGSLATQVIFVAGREIARPGAAR